MQATARIFDEVDLYVAPLSATDEIAPGSMLNVQLTNLTGHPAVTVPTGFTSAGTPTGITLIGRLYGEAQLLAIAKAYQEATGHHRHHPPGFGR